MVKIVLVRIRLVCNNKSMDFTEPLRMIKLLCVLLLLFATPVFAADNITDSTLPNGLRLIVLVDKQTPLVITQVWYRTGSADEVMGHTGLAHMLEHVMFVGTKKYPGDTFDKLISEQGGYNNAMTSFDYTAYYELLPADQLSLALRLEADRMQHLDINQISFDKEHHAVIEELEMSVKNNPIDVLWRQLYGVAFASTPYDHIPIGWDNDVQQFTRQDAKDWYDRWYAPNNATLVIAGDVDPIQVEALVNKYFASIPMKTLPLEKKFPLPPALGEKTVVVRSELAKVPQLILSFSAPNIATLPEENRSESYALDVFSKILSEKLTKKLVRADPPTATFVSVSYQSFARFNLDLSVSSEPVAASLTPSIKAGSGEGKSSLARWWSRAELYLFGKKKPVLASSVPLRDQDHLKTLQALSSQELSLIDAFKNTMVTDEELARAKAQLKAGYLYSKDSLNDRALLLGSLSMVRLPLDFECSYLKGVDAVTPAEVQNVVKKYVNGEHLTIGYLEPMAQEKAQ